MNWLAHLALSPSDPLLRIGNLGGDFVAGLDLGTLLPEVRRGIDQHRALDRAVDAHPVALRSRARLGPQWRRFAGVLTDVFFDHFLARDWQLLGDGRPLAEFAASTYELLASHASALPPRLREVLPALRAENWLCAYATLDGIDTVLARMGGRVRRRTPLAVGGRALRAHYHALAADFAVLWPDLVRCCRPDPPR